MSTLYALGAIAAMTLVIPAIIFRGGNGVARWWRRRGSRALPLAAFLMLAACNVGDASEATIAGCGDLPCDAGADASTPCASQDPACPVLPHVLVCPWYDGGPCQLSECMGAWRDCNHDAADGCEADTSTDRQDCGACGMACPAGFCVSGVCE